jgi:hypothetical protein
MIQEVSINFLKAVPVVFARGREIAVPLGKELLLGCLSVNGRSTCGEGGMLRSSLGPGRMQESR